MGFWERAVFRDLSVFAAWIGGGGDHTVFKRTEG